MNIFQQALSITSGQDDVQVVLALMFLIVAVILFKLAVEVGVQAPAHKTVKAILSANYWIKRKKRKGFGYHA